MSNRNASGSDAHETDGKTTRGDGKTTRGDGKTTRGDGTPILSVSGLKKHFPVNTGFLSSITFNRGDGFPLSFDDSSVKAVDGVDFSLRPGETFAVVGESGCGKSTLARTILGLEEPTTGEIRFDGHPVEDVRDADFHERTQMVFQDPESSLNARRKVGPIIEDPLEGSGWEPERRRERAMELLEQVGLKREYYDRYPHEFSGGQRQRINLARALSISPDLVVADEPVSGLDVSVQAQIINLMIDLQREFGLTYLLISHNLSVVRHIADRVAVMYLGDFVEVADADRLFAEQHHPYARALLSAVPNPDPDMPGVRSELQGSVPSASDPPRGCKFHTRCPDFILPDGFDGRSYEAFESILGGVRDRDLPVGNDDSPEALVDEITGTDLPSTVASDARKAIRLAMRDEWEQAESLLRAHESACQRTTPRLERVGDGRRVAACHLTSEEVDHDRV